LRVAVNAEQLLYRSPGGIGRYTAQLLTVVPDACGDVEAVPFTARHRAGDVERALAAAGVRSAAVHQALPRPLLYESWVRLGRPALRGLGGVDVVHAPSVAVPPRAGLPLVVTVHDAAPVLFPEAFPARGRRFHHLALRAVARRADAVIAVSHAAAEEIAANTPIPAGRIRVVHNAVDPPSLDARRVDEVLAGLGLAGRPYVLWVGSVEPRKGVGTLVAAMATLARRGRGATLVLAGFEGWLQRGLLDPADVEALGSSLVRPGRVGEEELWCLYRGASVFAFPSRHEGFGLPALEAMSQGTAVVASDIPALREGAGGAALLAPPGDTAGWAEAIGGLLDDEPARRRLGEAGRARSGSFGPERMAEATRAVYREVAS
jgi:glycosyltransferase involved in cell wall biosynthesis